MDAIQPRVGLRSASGTIRIVSWLVLLCSRQDAHHGCCTRGQNPFHPGLPPEGELYRAEAVDLGVSITSIGLTDRVTNTAQEAAAIRRLLPQDQPTVLLVTSAFHMRRAQVLFERQGLTVLPYPVDFQARAAWAGSIWQDPLQWLPRSRDLDDSSRALRELMGRLVYRSW